MLEVFRDGILAGSLRCWMIGGSGATGETSRRRHAGGYPGRFGLCSIHRHFVMVYGTIDGSIPGMDDIGSLKWHKR